MHVCVCVCVRLCGVRDSGLAGTLSYATTHARTQSANHAAAAALPHSMCSYTAARSLPHDNACQQEIPWGKRGKYCHGLMVKEFCPEIEEVAGA